MNCIVFFVVVVLVVVGCLCSFELVDFVFFVVVFVVCIVFVVLFVVLLDMVIVMFLFDCVKVMFDVEKWVCIDEGLVVLDCQLVVWYKCVQIVLDEVDIVVEQWGWIKGCDVCICVVDLC